MCSINDIKNHTISLSKVGNTIEDIDIKVIEGYIQNGTIAEKLECVGTGCFGRVYRYKSLNGNTFAIKVGRQTNENAYVSEANDINTLLDLRGQKNITKIHAYQRIGKDYFIMVVDFVEGILIGNINFNCDFEGLIIRDDIVDVFRQTISRIVDKGYILNDLHGENIMLNMDGYAIIVDYGGIYKSDERNGYTNGSYSSSLERIAKLKSKHDEYMARKEKRELFHIA